MAKKATAPGFEILPTTERVLAMTLTLCEQTDAKGNLVQDAFLAAHAMEHGCVRITTDRDFSRFPTLTCRLPARDLAFGPALRRRLVLR